MTFPSISVLILPCVILQLYLPSVDPACSASKPCNPKSCCSQWGSCGFGPDFCGKGCQADCNAEPLCSSTKLCDPRACCSKYSSCGFGSDYCGDGCQSGCDAVKPEGECSAKKPCKVLACCSEFGNCGYGPAFCGKGCQASCDAKPECGEFADEKECPLGVCCSKWGNCGLTTEFCEGGCQSGCSSPSKPSCSSPPTQFYIGYYASWARSRKCSAYTPKDIDPRNFTHLNYAFGTIREGVMVAPTGDDLTSIQEFTNLKNKNNELKVLISVGGWEFNDPGPTQQEFHRIVSTYSNRRAFIASVTQYLEEYKFDGIDIDYEYPGAEDRGGKRDDTLNYLQLISEMRGAFGNKYLITIAAPASYWYLRHFKIGKMSKYLDWINLMTYDFHGTWDAGIADLGPYLNAHTDVRMIYKALDLCFRDGVPSGKIVLGLGYYGRSFTMADPGCKKIGCKFSGPAKAGPCTNAAGVLALFEINQIIKDKNVKPVLDKTVMAKVLSWEDQWVSFDDEETLNFKRNLAAEYCLRGVMIWSIDQGEKPTIEEPVTSEPSDSVAEPVKDPEKSLSAICTYSSDWGTYNDEGCSNCGKRTFSSRLWNIKGSWEEACAKTVGKPPGYSCTKTSYCENEGFLGGEIGYFEVDDGKCDNPNWGSGGKYKDDGCIKDQCGVRRYSAQLFNIEGSWEDACAKTSGSPPGVKCQRPNRCKKDGLLGGIRGQWDVKDDSCSATNWGDFEDGGCSSPAYRQYSAVLYGVPKGVKWEGCCEGFGATIQGQKFSRPVKCENTALNLHIKGYFNVVDKGCLPNWSQCSSSRKRRSRSANKNGAQCNVFVNDLFKFALVAGLSLLRPPTRNTFCPDPIVSFQRGNMGRVEYLYAEIRPCNLDTGGDTTTTTRNYARTLGRSNDDAGHIVAKRLGGTGRDTYNIFPQSPNINRGVWTGQEAIVAQDVLAAAGGSRSALFPYARCTYRLLYENDPATRPFAVVYEFILPSGIQIHNDVVNP